VLEDHATITTTVERHRVRLELDRTEAGLIVAALSFLAGGELVDRKQRDAARVLLWRVVDDLVGPTRTIDRRTSADSASVGTDADNEIALTQSDGARKPLEGSS
jgi:hypothetical protein